MSRPTPQPAPWASQFTDHLSHMASPEFVLATLDQFGGQAVPRARYCIYRGMWADLPPNKHNPAERNPAAWASDCPTFTTDARMQKGAHITGGRRGGGERDAGDGAERQQPLESGGGGPVEAVWWIKDEGIMAQWRVKGTAYVLGRDIGETAAAEVREAIMARMRPGEAVEKTQEWSWDREITAHFGNVSPGMRGTFKNPAPGYSKSDISADDDHQLGDKVEDLHHSVARSNFRVVVILPDEVERVELADPSKARRITYAYDETKGTWSEVEQWP